MLVIPSDQFRTHLRAFNALSVEQWNAGDLKGYCDGYAEDASYLSRESGYVCSRENILKMYQAAYTECDMGEISMRILELYFPFYRGEKVNCAVAMVRFDIAQMQKGRQVAVSFSSITYVLSESGLFVRQETCA